MLVYYLYSINDLLSFLDSVDSFLDWMVGDEGSVGRITIAYISKVANKVTFPDFLVRMEERKRRSREERTVRIEIEKEAAKIRAVEDAQAAEAEAVRIAEERKVAKEAAIAKAAAEIEAAKIAEEMKIAEEAAKAAAKVEAERIAEEMMIAEEVAKVKSAKIAEEMTIAEEAAKAEAARIAEENRLTKKSAAEAKAAKIAKVVRLAEEAAKVQAAEIELTRLAEETQLHIESTSDMAEAEEGGTREASMNPDSTTNVMTAGAAKEEVMETVAFMTPNPAAAKVSKQTHSTKIDTEEINEIIGDEANNRADQEVNNVP